MMKWTIIGLVLCACSSTPEATYGVVSGAENWTAITGFGVARDGAFSIILGAKVNTVPPCMAWGTEGPVVSGHVIQLEWSADAGLGYLNVVPPLNDNGSLEATLPSFSAGDIAEDGGISNIINATSGSIDVTSEGSRTTGQFSVSWLDTDGGSAALSGSFDVPTCAF